VITLKMTFGTGLAKLDKNLDGVLLPALGVATKLTLSLPRSHPPYRAKSQINLAECFGAGAFGGAVP
jgi:hypothetical protein